MLSNNNRAATLLLCGAASFLLAACDQSINNSGLSEPKLTGMYCDAKADQEKNCQIGDVIVTVAGRERLLCDWAWQVVREPGSNEVLCILRGAPREVRSPLAGGPEK
jgi:hypothetical protein